ncbi:MAG: BglII/BstYI family type II restriction endonuclease [Alphaproteobacteria bacterium]
MLEPLQKAGFDILALHHAEAILLGDMPTVVDDLEAILAELEIPIEELVRGGGGEAKLTQRLRRAFASRGWEKRTIEIRKLINGQEISSLSHEIDHVKAIGPHLIALEIEWNNKDPFFDRDLESFKRLHADGAISVGIVVTRGESLHSSLRELVVQFAVDRGIKSLADLDRFGYRPTARQRREVERRSSSAARNFAQAWAGAFVADKFGESTTHWRKLSDRVSRGVGNPCPLLLIGIPKSSVIA